MMGTRIPKEEIYTKAWYRKNLGLIRNWITGEMGRWEGRGGSKGIPDVCGGETAMGGGELEGRGSFRRNCFPKELI